MIQTSFDGGQTFSVPQVAIRYLPDFSVSAVTPASAVVYGAFTLSLSGSGFADTPDLGCKIVSPSSVEYFATSVVFSSSSLLRCVFPSFSPIATAGDYAIHLSVNGVSFASTGHSVAVVNAAATGAISPTRGYFFGGTLVTISGSAFIDDPSTVCTFGQSSTAMAEYVSAAAIKCRAPPCTAALGWSNAPAACHGDVAVSVTSSGVASSSGAQFTYVAEQKIVSLDPWFASAWDAPFPVTIYGKGFTDPMYCKWLNLGSTQATNIVSGITVSNPEVDSVAECIAPILPDGLKPAAASGQDFLLAYVELSCNDADFTSDRRQWMFFAPPVVTGVSPMEVWAGSARTGGITVHGTNFREINPDKLACLWYYNSVDVEIVPATFIDKTSIFCLPLMPAGVNAVSVRVEVRMSPNVVSASGVALNVIPRPVVASVVSQRDMRGHILGGDVLTVTGSGFTGSAFVVIGDSVVVADSGTDVELVVRVPPRSAAGDVGITVVLNAKDQLAVVGGVYKYVASDAGFYYPLLEARGIAFPCPPGRYCPAGSAAAIPCPPGSFAGETGHSGCSQCPSPSFCPEPESFAPKLCESGRVCWSAVAGTDADAGFCPFGKGCAVPSALAIPNSIPLVEDPLDITRVLMERGRRLAVVPGSLTAPCPEGFFCGPGFAEPLACSVLGVYCVSGSASPYSLDSAVPDGQFVTPSGQLADCPAGHFCVNGVMHGCAPGSFQDQPAQSECKPCTGGTVCSSTALALPELCPSGFVCSQPGRVFPSYLCPAGSYCLAGVFTLNSTADVESGTALATQCAPGTYCSPGTNAAVPDLLNPSAPRSCAIGSFCLGGNGDYQGSGACLAGSYCPSGAANPIPAPAGHYVASAGAYEPTKCSPGFYQNDTGQVLCKPCPAGFECPDDAMVSPATCAAGHYRAAGDAAVACHPCPEGTWSWRGQLQASSECTVCPPRYVCGIQGMTVFATKDQTDCTPNGDGVVLCYANSQAKDCPEGYACDAGTTSYTQFNYPCEAGYFCKSLTAIDEMRNLLCPAGHTCSVATGASKAYAITCPGGFYCPEGTASVDQADGSQELYNVQSTAHVGSVDPTTLSQCRRCDPNTFSPPESVATTDCQACGVLNEATNTYIANTVWERLQCPDGTDSNRGSMALADCLQTGSVLAVVNVYNSTAVVVNSRRDTETPLWAEDREKKWVQDPQSKPNLQFGQRVSGSNNLVVDFIAFDPRVGSAAASEFRFTSVTLDSLDVAIVRLDFSKLPSALVMTTDANPGGKFDLVISSGVVERYALPFPVAQSNGSIQTEWTLKLTSLMDGVAVNVSVALLDGSHYGDMHFFNDAVNVEVVSPNRSALGTPRAFYSVISSKILNAGGYELPYNMIPSFANQPGDLSLVLDLADTKNAPLDASLKNSMIPGTTFWQVAGSSTVALPWLPFFSNCDYFDKHILLWDLLERNALPAEAGECRVLAEEDTRVVAPLIFDFARRAMQFQSESDFCELAISCRYEDNLAYTGGDAVPWMSIPSSGSSALFYLTQSPTAFADIAGPDFLTSLGKTDALEGTDALIPVLFDASLRTGKFPRLLRLQIDYAQVTTSEKRIVQAKLVAANFDDDATRTDYVLQVSFEPMNWIQLMNAFQQPFYVYVVVYVLIGFAVVGLGVVAWGVLKLARKSPRIPRFQILDCYRFFLSYTVQGVVVGSVPALFVAGLVKVIQLPSVGFLASVPCAWSKGSTSTSSLLILQSADTETCRAARTGTSLIISGVFMLWSASKFFSPRLPETHKEYLLSASNRKLQEDGVFFPAKKRFSLATLATVTDWKRVHLFFIMFLLCLPLMTLFSFSYSSMFGSFTMFYTAGYTMTMLIADLLFVKVAREKLSFTVLAVVTDVVFFIATLAAQDLNAFILSFIVGVFFIVAQRLIAESVIAYVYERALPGFGKWVRSRKTVWQFVLAVKRVSELLKRRQPLQHKPLVEVLDDSAAIVEGDVKGLKFSQPKAVTSTVRVKAVSDLDNDADQVAGVASRSLSLIYAPFAILLLYIFDTETLFITNYGLRKENVPLYLLFSVIIIPFQIGLELAINHAFDSSMHTRIYDYMYLCEWRWKNRLTRWLLDDARLDSSIGQSSQTMHHLAFSPQFHFIVTYALYGGVFVCYGITCWIAQGVPALLDPATGAYVLIMLVAQRFADAIARWLVFYVMWKPADRAPEKAFVQSIALGLKQKELEEHQVAFRNFFFKRHREWIIGNLDKVYTPRGIAKYRNQLSEIYQKVLSIRIPYLYSAPVKKPPPVQLEKPTDDEPDLVTRMRAENAKSTELVEVPLQSDEEDTGDYGAEAPVTYSLLQGWFETARRRVRVMRMAKSKPASLTVDTEEPGETFPDWLVVNISDSSKALLKQWLVKAKENVSYRHQS